MVAAADPRFDVFLSQGNPTNANLTASGGEPLLDLRPEHWLVTACPGDLMDSPNGGGLKSIRWRELEVTVYKILLSDAAISNHTVHGHTASLPTISSMFRMAHAGGLEFKAYTSI